MSKRTREDINTADLIRLYSEGNSLCDLVKLRGLSYGAIRYRLLRAGIKFRTRGESIRLAYSLKRPIQRKDIKTSYLVELYGQGNSLEDIRSITGLACNSIQHRLSHVGGLRSRSEAGKLAADTKKYHLKGENSNHWKGGRRNHNGYIKVYQPGHHRAGKDKAVFEHILVWEQAHNKLLSEGYIIHHLNGVKDDNRIQNLVAFPRSEHNIEHGRLLSVCRSRIRKMEKQISKLNKQIEILSCQKMI